MREKHPVIESKSSRSMSSPARKHSLAEREEYYTSDMWKMLLCKEFWDMFFSALGINETFSVSTER